jgi:hypothetical protein
MFDIQIQLKKNPPLCKAERLDGCAQKKEKGMSYGSLSHSKRDCKYHIVFIPKGRKKGLYGKIRKYIGPVLHDLARHIGDLLRKNCIIKKGGVSYGSAFFGVPGMGDNLAV